MHMRFMDFVKKYSTNVSKEEKRTRRFSKWINKSQFGPFEGCCTHAVCVVIVSNLVMSLLNMLF